MRFVTAFAAAAALVLSASVAAAASYDSNVTLLSDDYPFFTGHATLHIGDDNVLTASVTITGADPSACLPLHVHTGDCASMDTTEVLDLEPVCTDADGDGAQTSTVQLTPEQVAELLAGVHHVMLHAASHMDTASGQKGRILPILHHADIACGDLAFDAVPVKLRSWGAVKALYR